MEKIPLVQCTEMECCAKKFHAICVSNWLENYPSCPLCRATVKRINFQGHVIPFGNESSEPDDGMTMNEQMENEASQMNSD